MQYEGQFDCAFCGATNAILVDPSGGLRQQYTEDCQTCCRPNLLVIEIDDPSGEVRIDAGRDSD